MPLRAGINQDGGEGNVVWAGKAIRGGISQRAQMEKWCHLFAALSFFSCLFVFYVNDLWLSFCLAAMYAKSGISLCSEMFSCHRFILFFFTWLSVWIVYLPFGSSTAKHVPVIIVFCVCLFIIAGSATITKVLAMLIVPLLQKKRGPLTLATTR